MNLDGSISENSAEEPLRLITKKNATVIEQT